MSFTSPFSASALNTEFGVLNDSLKANDVDAKRISSISFVSISPSAGTQKYDRSYTWTQQDDADFMTLSITATSTVAGGVVSAVLEIADKPENKAYMSEKTFKATVTTIVGTNTSRISGEAPNSLYKVTLLKGVRYRLLVEAVSGATGTFIATVQHRTRLRKS